MLKKYRKILRSNGNFNKIYINENLTKANNFIAYNCRKLKRNREIEKTYSRDGIIHISKQQNQKWKGYEKSTYEHII